MSVYYNKGIAFGTGSNAAFNFKDKTIQHSVVNPSHNGETAFAKWGEDNRYPNELLKATRLSGVAGGALEVRAAAHIGQGLKLYKITVENGKEKKELQSITDYEDVKKFFRESKVKNFINEKAMNLDALSLAFPEFILSNDFKKITSVKNKQTAKGRYQILKEKTGTIENVYFCENWQSNTDVKSKYVTTIPVIDAFWTPEQARLYCKEKNIHRFIRPAFYPMLDETYYPETSWHAVFKNGWLEVVNSIPEFKKHMFKNQLNIKYMVYISEEYFSKKYEQDWLDFTPEKKEELRNELANAIDEHLSGNTNAGKSIQSIVFKDSSGEWVKGIEVVPLENNIKDGSYLPEATAGNSEILFAMAVDPTILGAGIPGGKANGGSGSDKREAYTILSSLFKTKRDVTLDSIYFIRDYNDWDEDLEFDFANTELTTLDANPTGSQTTL